MVGNITLNSPGTTVVTYSRELATDTSTITSTLNSALSSGGESDYLYTNTNDSITYLQSLNNLNLNRGRMRMCALVDARGRAQIQGIQVMQNIASQLSSRLTSIRNAANPPDTSFVGWCQDQLTAIGRELNHMAPDGNYALASLTNNVPPVDPSKFTALAAAAGPDTTYLVGAFGVVVNVALPPTTVHAGSAGTEALIRSLRICLSGDVTNANAPEWTSAKQLVDGTAIPGLASDLEAAGQMSQAAQDYSDGLDAVNSGLADIGQKAGFLTPMAVMQWLKELEFLQKMQEGVYVSMISLDQKIQEQLDKLGI